MSNKRNDILKDTFSKVVLDYDYARPTYPPDLFHKIVEFSNLKDNASILEIGAGSGQATDLFISNNRVIDLIEVSDEQVMYLKNKYRDILNISVYQDYFESFLTDKKYDLIYSATAFHWVDSEIGYPKAWKMLKDTGTMAVFWHMFSVTYHNTGIFEGLNLLKQKYLPNESQGFDDEGIKKVVERRINQIKSGGYFSNPEICEYKWTDIYNADKYAALINTYSSTQLLNDMDRDNYLNEIVQFINSNGGYIEVPQRVILFLVKK